MITGYRGMVDSKMRKEKYVDDSKILTKKNKLPKNADGKKQPKQRCKVYVVCYRSSFIMVLRYLNCDNK